MNKKPVSYFQTDPRWKNNDYSAKGEKTTIGASGCGPTCAAMLIETITGETFTPADACKWSLDHGYKAPKQGTYYSYFAPQFAAFGIECYQLSWTNIYHKPDSPIHDKALSLLNANCYLIALMKKGLWTTGGHYVVVWKKDNKIYINDPISTSPARTEANINQFKNDCAYYWVVKSKPMEDEMKIYKHLQDVPESYRGSIKKLMDRKVLNGYEDPDPNRLDDNIIDVSEDFCRIITVLDKAKVFD